MPLLRYFVSSVYGVVTRETNTLGEWPASPICDDPWIDISDYSVANQPTVGDHYDGSTFTLDHGALSVAQGEKLATLRDACADHIKNKNVSTTMLPLGMENISENYEVRTYPTKHNDQFDILAAFAAAIFAEDHGNLNNTYSVWCAVGDRANCTDWDIRDHTIPQLKQIAQQLHQHVNDAQYELKEEVTAVLAATTVSAIEAIVWIPPNS